MGSCIICGTSVDGHICQSHEEDVYFEFRGDGPEDLVSDRFYRGTVDGYADFGVFVDIGDAVTGLLHRSKLDQRLESLSWDPGDSVFVQVLDVKDNGNVDLGWSIREREDQFRGKLVQTPDGEVLPDDAPDSDSSPSVAEDGGATTDATPAAAEPTASLERTAITDIGDYVGSPVRLEGEITGVRQTSGPTVFELSDETATVECAAFEEAGVRAYPEVELEDVVALIGEVEHHQGSLQVETERLERLEGEEEAAVLERRREAVEAAAEPESVDLLADHPPVAAVEDDIVTAATAIRRAVTEGRPVVIRHRQSADGYIGGAALERAVLPLVREQHTREDAVYHYVERRPLEGPVYGMDDATGDVSSMLESRDRFGEALPLVVLVDAGGTDDSVEAYEFLDIYGAETVVVEDCRADETVAAAVDVAVAPSLAGESVEDVTASALAVNVAAHVTPSVRQDLRHLPAISYWEAVPPAYLSLATEAGFDGTAVAERREAIALEAYYQSYKDKRELVDDLLFDGADGLVEHISEQFRQKLATELETARQNLTEETHGDVTIDVLETDAFTNRFSFPPEALLVEALHRDRREDRPDPSATLAVGEDTLRVQANSPVDVRSLGAAVAERAPEAGVRVVGGRDGHLRFVPGERVAVRDAATDEIAALLSP